MSFVLNVRRILSDQPKFRPISQLSAKISTHFSAISQNFNPFLSYQPKFQPISQLSAKISTHFSAISQNFRAFLCSYQLNTRHFSDDSYNFGLFSALSTTLNSLPESVKVYSLPGSQLVRKMAALWRVKGNKTRASLSLFVVPSPFS